MRGEVIHPPITQIGSDYLRVLGGEDTKWYWFSYIKLLFERTTLPQPLPEGEGGKRNALRDCGMEVVW